jgi:hypothetical protein
LSRTFFHFHLFLQEWLAFKKQSKESKFEIFRSMLRRRIGGRRKVVFDNAAFNNNEAANGSLPMGFVSTRPA